MAHQRGLPAEEAVWISQRGTIYEEVMDKGWNPRKNSFVGYYDPDGLDVALLLTPVVECVGPGDPRWLATLASGPGDQMQRGS